MSDSLYKSDCLRLWEMNQSSNHYCFSLRQKLSTFGKKLPQVGNLFRVIPGKKVTKLWKYQVFITKVNHYCTPGLQIMQIHLVQNSTSANFPSPKNCIMWGPGVCLSLTENSQIESVNSIERFPLAMAILNFLLIHNSVHDLHSRT